MTGYLGRYEHQMDEKGRVSLPSAFRGSGDGDRFVLLQWNKPHLTLLPEQVWSRLQEDLLRYRKSGPGAGNQVREITSRAAEVMPDKQGRLLIPSWLKEEARLHGTVLMIGNIDRVEIWNPEDYQKSVADQAGDWERYAHQIFG